MANAYDTLYDSDTNDSLTAADLGITEQQYEDAIAESSDCDQVEGHITVNARRVYAA